MEDKTIHEKKSKILDDFGKQLRSMESKIKVYDEKQKKFIPRKKSKKFK